MGQLLLVRHGQASADADDYDVLSPLGWEQSRTLGCFLAERAPAPGLVLHGSMRRHVETTTALVEAAGWQGREVVEDDGWNEFDHVALLASHPAPFAGRRPSRREFQEWFDVATARWTAGAGAPDVESFAAFGDRVSGALRRAVSRLGSGGTAVVVTSGGPVAWATASLMLGTGVAAPVRAATWSRLNRVVVNSSVTKIVVGRSGTTLVAFNEHAHLGVEQLSYR